MGNSWPDFICWGQEITVKVYGVAVMMPQVYSRVSNPLIECK